MSGRFAFLVHPLTPLARQVHGLRRADARYLFGRVDGTDPALVAPVARVGLGDVSGLIVVVPMLPAQLLDDQGRALAAMVRAVQLAAPVEVVGLGSVLAAVAGRGVALEAAIGVPVTTGNAATAWAATEVTRRVAAGHRRVAVLGARGATGRVIAERLAALGFEVGADPERLAAWPVVVGAHTTGGVVSPSDLAPDAVLVDVALPPTLSGPPPPGVRVYAGEALALPAGWRRDVWGHVFHIVAGYGWDTVYACLAEPLVALREGRARPYAQGRRVRLDDVEAFGEAATRAGFYVRVRPLPRPHAAPGIG